jgi:hypothetical protein
MAEKATGPQRPGDKASPEGKPGPPDRASDAGPGGARDEAGQPDGATPADEARSGFRAALERKRAQEAEAAGAPRGRDGGKVHGARGPAASRRSFRRKSGG